MLRPLRPREPGQDDSLTPSGSNNTPPRDTGTKRKRVGAAACRACRKRKSKCDGGRPSCGRCGDSNVECSYDSQPGQTRLQAVEEKNGKLENLFDKLKMASQSEIEVLLSRIRDGTALDDVGDTSVTEPRKEESPEAGGESSVHAARVLSAAQRSPFQAETTAPALPENTLVRPLLREDTNDSRVCTMSPVGLGFTKVAVSDDVYNTLVPLRSLIRTSPADATFRAHLTDLLGYVPMPNVLITKTCVTEFFRASGKIFHVFQPVQVFDAIESTFSTSNAVKDKMHMSLVCITAAIGSFYLAGTDTFYPQLGEHYYRIAKIFLEDIVATQSRESVKICALLALYNILRQNISCLAFAELAIVLAKQQGLQALHKPLVVEAETWLSGRRVWRLLIFLQSWMVVTNDYTTETLATEDISSLNINEETDLEDLAQRELAKIAVLKARMVYKLALFREPTLTGVSSMMADLRGWYAQLPHDMKMEYVGPTLTVRLRTVVQYVQLMYLNAVMLLHRAVIAHSVKMRASETSSSLGMAINESSEFLNEGIVAATSSALILAQMHTPDTVFKHCWIAIFQSYVSIALLLYAVVQARTNDDDIPHSPETAGYLHAAEQCLKTLEFCANSDDVAKSFLRTIEGHYYFLSRKSAETKPRQISDEVVEDSCRPPTSLEESGAMLLQLLCHPLRRTKFTTNTNKTTNENDDDDDDDDDEEAEKNNDIVRTITEHNLKSTYPDDSAIARLVERLDVGYEDRLRRGIARSRPLTRSGTSDSMLAGSAPLGIRSGR